MLWIAVLAEVMQEEREEYVRAQLRVWSDGRKHHEHGFERNGLG